jgi:hypothetical protein
MHPKKPEEKKQEEPQAQPEEKPAEASQDDEISEEEAEKLPFPAAAVVRIMKANMDNEKMIKKDVKIGMNKWLGNMCARVSREMNKFPYVMMHLNELNEGKRIYEDMESFDKEKQRILAHMDAMKRDIERLERDLGKKEEEVITREDKKE